MFTADTLAKKRILITGGGSGLGLAMAVRFLDLGAHVAVCGRSEEKLKLAKEAYPKLFTVRCDVREYEQVGAMFDLLAKDFGTPNCLVNNAAGNFLCASEDLSPNAFRTVIDIVLQGSFNCSSHFGKRLIASKDPGSILNIVTTYTETGSGFVLPSACAKAGLYAMTTSLAYEWATYQIRVNAIAPGPFPTKGAWERLVPTKELEETFKAQNPTGRFGDPAELTNLAAFLLSDLSPYISGECVNIDGAERLSAGQFNFLAREYPRGKLKETLNALRGVKS